MRVIDAAAENGVTSAERHANGSIHATATEERRGELAPTTAPSFAVVGGGRLRALAARRTTEGRTTSVDASTGRPGALASTYASNVRVCVVAAWSMLRGRTGRVVGVVDGELLVALDGDAGPPLRFGRAALETEDTCD